MKVILLLINIISFSVFAKTHEIKMLNSGKEGMMVFEPAFVKADVGDQLHFKPTDPSHGSASVFVPMGAKGWKGEPDKEVTGFLDKEGVFIFSCVPHASMGMVGVVQVGKATNFQQAKDFSKKYVKSMAINQERLTRYLDLVSY